jgi:hypothetical protein
MGVVWLLARGEARRRGGSLLSLAVLVALVSGVVLTALVGAHRTSTTVDRFHEWAGASDLNFQADTSEEAAAMLAVAGNLPEVELAATRYVVNAFIPDGAISDIAVMTDPDGVYGTTLDRPRLLTGRLPAIDAPDEVVLNELAARLTGLDVGDRLPIRTWSPADLEALFSGPDFPGFNGPRVSLEVVGIGRVPEELPGEVKRTSPYAIASPSFLAAHPDVGAWPPAIVVRLRGGADDIEAVAAGMADFSDAGAVDPTSAIGTTAAEVYLDTSQQTVDRLAAALLVFAGSSAIAGAIAIGQAMNRQLSQAMASVGTLRSLGLTRAATGRALAAPLVAAGVLGVVVGGAVAVAASPLLPTGLARRAEIEPGVWVDPGVLGAGVATLAVLVAIAGLVVARHAVLRASRSGLRAAGAAPRVPAATWAALRAGVSPPVLTGVRMANERGPAGAAVPVRSAVFGVALGIAGVVAAGVVTSSLHQLTADPANWGWNWSTLPDYFGDDDIRALEARFIEDPRVDAVGSSSAGSMLLDDQVVTSWTLEALSGSMTLTRRSGRLPSGPREVALGEETLDDLGLSIGDTVASQTAAGAPTELVIVGTVVLPPTEEPTIDVGAALTPDAFEELQLGEPLESLVVRYPSDVDPAELEAALAEDYGLEFGPFTQPQEPGGVRSLAEGRDVVAALAAFFSALAGLGLLHALLVSTRRRRGDLAVLRSLGLKRAQVRGAILVEALVLALGGLVVGIPAGLIVGRFVWRALVADLGALADPATPWSVLAVILPAVAAAAAVASWWPGRSAVRAGPAAQLRTE